MLDTRIYNHLSNYDINYSNPKKETQTSNSFPQMLLQAAQLSTVAVSTIQSKPKVDMMDRLNYKNGTHYSVNRKTI